MRLALHIGPLPATWAAPDLPNGSAKIAIYNLYKACGCFVVALELVSH
jgi:hypothetical protein